MKPDPYHNEFINTGAIFESEFMKNLAAANISVDGASGKVEGETTETSSERPGKRKRSLADIKRDRIEKEGDSGEGGYFSSRLVSQISALKEAMIVGYSKAAAEGADNSQAAKVIEEGIARIEKIERELGVRDAAFEPVRHKTGLKSKDELENTNRVIENTVSAYDLHSIFEISSMMNGNKPAIALAICGQNDSEGFVVKAMVTAKEDFSGNEAIDYVHDAEGGLVTVKAFLGGVWRDVSSGFKVSFETVSSKLERKKGYASLYVGEEIVKQGKGVFEKTLELKDGDLQYGKEQIFSLDPSVIDRIKGMLRAKVN